MWRDQPLIHIAAAVTATVALVFAVVVDDTNLRTGLFGFVGTLAGALATFEATQLATRGDRRRRKRAAGRLLQDDLLFARTRCRNARANGRFWAPRFDLREDGWERYCEIVSQELEDNADWQKVASAFGAMRAVQSKCSALRPAYGDRPGLGPRSVEVIEEYLLRSDAAMDALRRLSGDRPPDELLTDEQA